MSVCEWDISGVNDLYQKNPKAKAFLDDLATRGRAPNANATTVDELVEKYQMSRPEAIETLRELDTAKCGDFYTGRRGHPSRLVWSVRAMDVGKGAAQSGTDSSDSHSASNGSAKFLDHEIWIRSGVPVKLRLPQDLSREEAERLAGVVKNLWMSATQAPE